MRKVTPWLCKSFVRLTLKFCCSPVGTVAVAGVRVAEMPESRANVAKLDFLVSCTEVAVMIIARFGNFVGSGTLIGAVKVTVVLAQVTLRLVAPLTVAVRVMD